MCLQLARDRHFFLIFQVFSRIFHFFPLFSSKKHQIYPKKPFFSGFHHFPTNPHSNVRPWGPFRSDFSCFLLFFVFFSGFFEFFRVFTTFSYFFFTINHHKNTLNHFPGGFNHFRTNPHSKSAPCRTHSC